MSFLPRRCGETTDRRFSTVTGTPFRVFQPDAHWIGFDADARRHCQWSFFGADIDRPILGVDFLATFGVVIDFASDTVKIMDSSVHRPVAPLSRHTGRVATVYTVRLKPNNSESCRCDSER